MSYYKICDCKETHAFYYDFGFYRCQYCDGARKDLDNVRKIIDYNTPVGVLNRDSVIDKASSVHQNLLKGLFKRQKIVSVKTGRRMIKFLEDFCHKGA